MQDNGKCIYLKQVQFQILRLQSPSTFDINFLFCMNGNITSIYFKFINLHAHHLFLRLFGVFLKLCTKSCYKLVRLKICTQQKVRVWQWKQELKNWVLLKKITSNRTFLTLKELTVQGKHKSFEKNTLRFIAIL